MHMQIFPMEVALKRPAVPAASGVDRVDKRASVCEEGDDAGQVGSRRPSPDLKSASPTQRDASNKQGSTLTLTDKFSPVDATSRQSPSNGKEPAGANNQDQLESAKAEMGEVREENERLKLTLARIVRDYQSLQMQFFDAVKQEQTKKGTETASTEQEMEEPELVSLSLGTTSRGSKIKDDKSGSSSRARDDEQLKEGLTLGLDCKFEEASSCPTEPPANRSPENSFEEVKDEEAGEAWPPGKILKTLRSSDDEMSEQTQVKKARVSVRARCEAPTMNDGCQWRKYGQKIAKGNPCPRAYYRCTVAPGCPVRKQVQRCAEDMSILITTYEGTHNHPLPISATAMASTTSAAACMLMSGSSTSRQTLGTSSMATTSADLHGLNFSLSDRSRPFYLPNHSISSSPSYPTITLDLTAPPSSSASSHFPRPFSSAAPRFSGTSFNFSSSESTALPTSWGAGGGFFSYGTQPYNKNQTGSLNFGSSQSQEHFYQSYLQKSNPPQQALTETIAAATKAITADPNFRSALAAAITSIVGGGGGGGGEGFSLKWGEQVQQAIASYSAPPPPTPSGSSCAPSYLNRSSSSSNPQTANFVFLPPSLPFSTKSASASPVDNREHT